MKKTPTKTTISGQIFTITFRNSDNWCVFTIQHDGTTKTKCTGTLAEMIDVGSEVTATGIIETTKFGLQLKCEQVVPAAPDVSTEAGVIKLLQRLPGIGPKKAMQAVQEFGHEEAWRLAGADPAKLGVKPIDAEEAMQVASSLLDSYEATVYLLGIGLTDHQAATIYRQYGRNTIKMVSENPYQLVEIEGMGFITVDRIALKAGMSVGNPARISACILYVLDDAATNGGNVWHNGWSLADIVQDTLTNTAMKAEVPMGASPGIEDIRRQVHFLGAEEKVVIRKGRVFGKELLDAESRILEFVGIMGV